jgi:hypothetical protein
MYLTDYHTKYFAFIDERIFGDLKSFREQFVDLNNQRVFETLKAHLQPVCQRELRRQVLSYVRYTKRLPKMDGCS